MWGRPGAPAEVVEETVKLLVNALGLASASFAFGGKYHRKGELRLSCLRFPHPLETAVKMSWGITIPLFQVRGAGGR